MSWFILSLTSIISVTIILYALWPWTGGRPAQRILLALLVLIVLILPAGMKYYYAEISPRVTANAGGYTGKFPTIEKSVWSGGTGKTASINTTNTKNMSMSGVTARLEEKLKNNPDDIDGWILLGRSYAALDEPRKAIALFQDKISDNPDNINLLVSYGETLTRINNGIITDDAKELFLKARALEDAHPRVEYNLARYDMQHGRNIQAYNRLKTLLDTAPDNAPWIARIKESMALAAEKITQTPKQEPPSGS